MKNQFKISIIISTKDFTPVAEFPIKGFLNQSLVPFEIILVGPNLTLSRIKKHLNYGSKRKINFVEFTGDKNEARNIGFSKSSGDFVIYSDDDMVPQENLIEECIKHAKKFDALIIPEVGSDKGSFLQKIYKLEKELVAGDEDAITPRLFRKNFFQNGELPFDKKFGVLDEWGFNLKLKAKKPKVGTIKSSSFTVVDNSTLGNRIKKNFKKGLWIRNLIRENKKEGLRRVNPIKRGIQFYCSKSHYFKKTPVIFTSLLFIKLLDLLSFFLGLFASFVVRSYANQDKFKFAK